jgi:hypothetical protein
MSDFLLIRTASAPGRASRVGLNDIPRLFSEGVEEAAVPSVAWQSLWQSLRTNGRVTMRRVRVAELRFHRRFKQAI